MVEGGYRPADIEGLSGGVSQGHSEALHGVWRQEDGRLGCHDPAPVLHIATLGSERSARLAAEAGPHNSEAERHPEWERASVEQEARVVAEDPMPE